MKKTILAVLLGCSISVGAFASGVYGSAGVMSDYTFRGISQSNQNPSVTANINVDVGNFTIGGVATSVDKTVGKDRAELDATINYHQVLTNMFSVDLGGIYYNYPGTSVANTTEGNVALNMTVDKAVAQVKTSYSNDYFGSKKSAWYTELNGSYSLPWYGLSVVGHVGNLNVDAASSTYTDTKVGLDKTFGKSVLVEAAWVNSNATDLVGSSADLVGSRFVASAMYKF